jgi:hypothetical protein
MRKYIPRIIVNQFINYYSSLNFFIMLKHILNGSTKFMARISVIAVFVALFLTFGTTSAMAQDAVNGLKNPYEGKAQGTYGITPRDLGTWSKDQSIIALTQWLNDNLPTIANASITTRYQAAYYKMVLLELNYDIAIEISLIENFERAKSALVDGNNLTLPQMKGVYNATIDTVLP